MNNPDRTIDFRYAPTHRWTCIGRPNDSYKSLVDEQGRLLYGYRRPGSRFGTFRFRRVIAVALHTDLHPVAVTQQTESARIPIVVTRIDYPHARLTLRAVGHLHGEMLRTDLLSWQIEPLSTEQPVTTALWIDIQGENERFAPAGLAPSPFVYAFPPEEVPQWQGLNDLFSQHVDPAPKQGERPPFLVSVDHPLQIASSFDFGPSSGLRTDFAVIEPGDVLSGALLIPQNYDLRDLAPLPDRAWADAALNAERRFWQGMDLLPPELIIPDPDVMNMLTASARNILQAKEVHDGLAEFQVGPTVYRGFWVIDGYFFLEAARYAGWTDAAERGIPALLRRRRENGAIEERSLDTKDTGLALATLVRQCQLAGDLDRLRDLWPILRDGVRYIEQLHQEALALPKDDPAHGLLPPAFGNGGLGGIRAEYTTVLWLLVGVKSVARAARLLGMADEAQPVQAFFDRFFAAFHAHAERDRITLPDGTDCLPMLKPGSGSHHWIHDWIDPSEPPLWERVNPGTGTWALAHAIYPGELFSPDHPIVQDFCALLEHLDDEQGIPAATGWLPHKAVWTYAASFYAHVWLYAGRPDKAIDYLYAFANHASPTRVWREEQSLADAGMGQQLGDMPHNWASAEFIRLVRNLLVFERTDRIQLLPALPPEWLVAGAVLSWETPTACGQVDLHLTVDDAGQGRLSVQLRSGLPHPVPVELIVPAGPGFHLTELSVNGQSVEIGGQAKIPLTWAGQ